jgi:hypothetical protein
MRASMARVPKRLRKRRSPYPTREALHDRARLR